MIGISSSGSFDKTLKSLLNSKGKKKFAVLDRHGRAGVAALSKATPKGATGKTAASWGYRVFVTEGKSGIDWFNTNENDGVNIAVLIQYGHGTGTGGYISGRDFINPAILPIFEQIAADVWREVTNA